MTNIYTMTAVNRLRVDMEIGCFPQERGRTQPIEISFKMFSPAPVVGCETDRLEDTICYDNLCKQMRDFCGATPMYLIEHLGKRIYDLLRTHVGEEVKLWVKISKCYPPIEGLLGSPEFVYSDLPLVVE
jgi:dihydroneopterin aldolase